MKPLCMLLMLFVCASASAQPPTQASVEELFSLLNVPQQLELLKENMEQGMRRGIASASQGQTLTKTQQVFLNDVPTRFRSVMDQQLRWSDIEPAFVQIYSETFSEEEIDGAIAFYKSPQGHAFIEKMPLLSQKSQQILLQRAQPMIDMMKQQMQEALEQAKQAK